MIAHKADHPVAVELQLVQPPRSLGHVLHQEWAARERSSAGIAARLAPQWEGSTDLPMARALDPDGRVDRRRGIFSAVAVLVASSWPL